MNQLITILGIFLFTFNSFGQTKVTSGNVNFRTTPELKENKICVIPKGESVAIVEDAIDYENWIKVNYRGKTGYVYKEYLVDIPVSQSNSSDNSTTSEIKYYKNSKGEKVQSPTYYKSPPPGATAECKDGTYSFSKSRRGTCSHHGGVKRWL